MNTHLTTDVAPRANVQAERSDGPNGPRSRSHPCARAEQRSGMVDGSIRPLDPTLASRLPWSASTPPPSCSAGCRARRRKRRLTCM